MKKFLLSALVCLLLSIPNFTQASSGTISTPDSNNIVFRTVGPTTQSLPALPLSAGASVPLLGSLYIDGNNSINVGSGNSLTSVFNIFLMGSNNIALDNSSSSIAIGSANTLQATLDGSAIFGDSNQIIGATTAFIHGNDNFIGLTAPSAILASAGASIEDSSTYSTILSGFETTLTGQQSIAAINANLTGDFSLALGKGTFSGNGTVFLTDQGSSYSLTNKNAQFITRFASGLDLNTALISSVGALTLPTSGDLNFAQFTNASAITVSQTGTAVTLSPGATSAYFNGWLVPASGTAERLVGYNGTATMQASLSQTIAGGTSATIYYNTDNADLVQGFPAVKTFFGSGSNVNFVQYGVDSNFAVGWLGAGTFNNGLAIGNATNVPINRVTSSTNPTASQSTTTVTASSSVFSSASVGKMILWNGGQTAFITEFTNGTTVTVDKSQTVAASQFIITAAGSTAISSEGNFGTNNAYIYNSLNMLSHAISNVLDPTNAQDAATKNYVDGRTTIHYLELNKSGTQSITLNTATPITYATSIFNTFGSNLTITGNNTFTNASGAGMYLTVSTVTAVDASFGGGSALWLYFKLTRASGTNTTPVCSTADIFAAVPLGCTQSFYLANGDSFQVIATTNLNNTLGTSGADGAGQTYKSSIVITQQPGF